MLGAELAGLWALGRFSGEELLSYIGTHHELQGWWFCYDADDAMIELMPKKYQNTVGTAWNCFEGSINLFATYYFMKVSVDWYYFVLIGLVFQVCSCCTVWFLPESPIFLLKSGRINELKDALVSIADWNGLDIDKEKMGDFGSVAEKKVHGGRRPDKAENVMKVSGLPAGTDEHRFRFWLADKLG